MLHLIDPLTVERDKYDLAWSLPEYSEFSPGAENVARFLKVMQPRADESLIDLGCGDGRAGLELSAHLRSVHWLDIVDALISEVPRENFIESPIWGRGWRAHNPVGWDYGFCCDVFEHLPTEYAMLAAARIVENCRISWLQIAFEPDAFGAMVGSPLHLTVQPFEWWRDRLATVGKLIDARDLCGVGLFVLRNH